MGNKFKSAGLPASRSEVYVGGDGHEYVSLCSSESVSWAVVVHRMREGQRAFAIPGRLAVLAASRFVCVRSPL